MTKKRVVRIAVAALGLLVCVMMVPILMRASVQMYVVLPYGAPRADVALILGASVSRGAPSPVLADRADTAIVLYKNGAVKKILVTGDNGTLSHDEVTPVKNYLLDHGVRAEDIFLDHAGFDTYSSMYRARDIFGVHSLIITTQDFHMPRALWIARALGLTAYGVETGRSEGSVYDSLREIPASLKALADVFFHRVPQYLGEEIPIEGDGQSTWY